VQVLPAVDLAKDDIPYPQCGGTGQLDRAELPRLNIGGDEYEWTRGGAADVILDNLYADKKVVPMIVVLPWGPGKPCESG
jgi:hypothetical protein